MHAMKDHLEYRWVGALIANASNTDNNSSRIDMQNYESCVFIGAITASAATGVATFTIESNTADSDTGMTTTGIAATATSAANSDLNNRVLVAEIRSPAKRYIQLVRTSATANIAFDAVYAILTPRLLPPTQGTTVLASAFGSD